MIDQVVFQGGFLHIGGIVAPGTGLVSIPADFGAGRGFRFVVDQVMFQGGLLHIGGVITPGAGVVGVPAGFRAGGSLGFMMNQIMVIRVNIPIGLTAHRTFRLFRAGGFAAGMLTVIAILRSALVALGQRDAGSRAAGMALHKEIDIAVVAVGLMPAFALIHVIHGMLVPGAVVVAALFTMGLVIAEGRPPVVMRFRGGRAASAFALAGIVVHIGPAVAVGCLVFPLGAAGAGVVMGGIALGPGGGPVVIQGVSVFLAADLANRLFCAGGGATLVRGVFAVFRLALFTDGFGDAGGCTAGVVLPAEEPIAVIAIYLVLFVSFILIPIFMI